MNFENESRVVTPQKPGYYGFNRAPRLLFTWSSLFQRVISQAGTYLLTGKFHSQECSIYKTEGGCKIAGCGDLVLSDNMCYFDDGHQLEHEKKLAALITAVVLTWDPNDPIESMLASAACHVNVPVEKLRKAIDASTNGGLFGGNALADFFGWNPFSLPPHHREYLRFCLVKFDDKTEAEVNQQFSDEDLGKDLLCRINQTIKRVSTNWNFAMCCRPRRNKNGLVFWINTGRSTQIDGWKTQEELEAFIKSDGVLVDSMGD